MLGFAWLSPTYGLLCAAFLLQRQSSAFQQEAASAPGQVIELLRQRSGDAYVFRPLVQFVDQQGKLIQFMSAVGSNPAAFSVGETVEVLYLPQHSSQADINDGASRWGASLLLGGLGAVFF